MITKEKADLMNNSMIDGFHAAGLTVPISENHLESDKMKRTPEEQQERIQAAEARRAKKQAARRLLATKCGKREVETES